MAARRGAGTALQHELSAHELGVIFTRSAFGRDEAGIGQKRRTRPFPDIAEHLTQAAIRSRCTRAGSARPIRSEEHTSELQSLMRISYAVFCLKKKNTHK